MHRSLRSLLVLAACSFGLLGTAAAQQGSGIRYQVTTRMVMEGMPFQMPAQTQEVCGPKNSASEAMVPKRDNCQILDYKVAGNRSSFRMVCTGKDAMTGTGEFTYGPASYQGKITVNTEGHTMVMNFDGKKLGDCDYSKEGPQAKANAMLGKTCGDMLANGTAQQMPGIAAQFAPGAMCAGMKPKYCAKLAPVAGDLDFLRQANDMEASYKKQGIPNTQSAWDALALCGQPRASVLAKACPKAEKSGDYAFIGALCPDLLAGACDRADANRNADFVIDHCPARAAKLAAAQCAGRGYTAMLDSPYRDFCSSYAGKQLRQRNGGDDADGDSSDGRATPTPPAKKPSWKDKLKGVIGGG